ncbi:thioester-forming surface-anchored protein [Corynebacterium diphtheriae]|uniref:thioester-forming surface-anchored protein n=1 Tax=Corynebacterium diphtheriae TaxID=1717 RepID=UPI0015F39E35|nr:thioester-forming surface-anchored protein [Corynebacterium diphtheriae]
MTSIRHLWAGLLSLFLVGSVVVVPPLANAANDPAVGPWAFSVGSSDSKTTHKYKYIFISDSDNSETFPPQDPAPRRLLPKTMPKVDDGGTIDTSNPTIETFGALAYCFNANKAFPASPTSEPKQAVTKYKPPATTLHGSATSPRGSNIDADIKKVIWNGFLYDSSGLGKELTPDAFHAVTQSAIWYFTNGYSQNQQYMDSQLRTVYPDQIDKINRVYRALTEDLASLKNPPPGAELSVYDAVDQDYQNVLRTTFKKDGEVVVPVPPTVDPVPPTKVAPLDVTFSKVAEGQQSELPGASLTVAEAKVDEQGKPVAVATDGSNEGDRFENTDVVKSWISGSTAQVLSLEAGKTYTLAEDDAPAGYAIASEIAFRVSADGKTVEVFDNGQWPVKDPTKVQTKVQMVDKLKPAGPTPTPEPSGFNWKWLIPPLIGGGLLLSSGGSSEGSSKTVSQQPTEKIEPSPRETSTKQPSPEQNAPVKKTLAKTGASVLGILVAAFLLTMVGIALATRRRKE